MSRWLAVSMNPPVPMTAPFVNCRIPASSASAVASMTWSSVTPFSASCSRLDLHLACMLRRSPQIGDVGHARARCSRRARIFQYAVIDMSMTDTSSDDIPIFMTRLVADSGCSMTGGAAQVGRCGCHVGSRSCDELAGVDQVRARLEDQLDRARAGGADFERRTSRPVDAAERLLQRDGDQGLDLRRRTARGRRVWISTLRRRELGEDVDRHLPQLR